jgi:mannose/fructose/N-acetylgalactosamine-specific phosphotransferase system component IIC
MAIAVIAAILAILAISTDISTVKMVNCRKNGNKGNFRKRSVNHFTPKALVVKCVIFVRFFSTLLNSSQHLCQHLVNTWSVPI